VEAGEAITITVDGRPVALLCPVSRQPRWLSRSEFLRRIVDHQADAGMAGDLALLSGETTVEIPLR